MMNTDKKAQENENRFKAWFDQPGSEAYPCALKCHERKLLRTRRNFAELNAHQDASPVGIALSGGGIRSATFSLGVFQVLAQLQLLRRVDFLSTVSGGGYFGAFLGRQFARLGENGCGAQGGPAAVEKLLHPCAEQRRVPEGFRDPVEALRQEGRYLAPKGSGDLWLGFAVLMRNLVSVHVLLSVLFLAGFLAAQLLRGLVELYVPIEPLFADLDSLPGGETWLWWSPFSLLIPPWLILAVVPAGWAYWIVVRDVGVTYDYSFSKRPTDWYRRLVPCDPHGQIIITLATLVVLSLFIVGLGAFSDKTILSDPVRIGGLMVLISGFLAMLYAWWVFRHINQVTKPGETETQTSSEPASSDAQDAKRRNLVSRGFKCTLIALLVLVVLVFIDTLGQTFYMLLVRPGGGLGAWFMAVFAGLAGLAAGAKRLAVTFGGQINGQRLGRFTGAMAMVAGLLIAAIGLTAVNTLSHAIAWDFAIPPNAPEKLYLPDQPRQGGFGDAKTNAEVSQPASAKVSDGKPAYPPDNGSRKTSSDLVPAGMALIASTIIAWLVGGSWIFLNWSSHNPLYAARLTRAYLGASNPARKRQHNKLVDVVENDDMQLADYWRGKNSTVKHGAPLHLINVTINETIDGKTGIQNQDRKGTGMALGPAGLSVGVRHHAVFEWPHSSSTSKPSVHVEPEEPASKHRVFDYDGTGTFEGDPLTLGRWTAISGAAFSTGIGSRTNLGLSLLAGIGNVRLGHWWFSGVQRQPKSPRRRPLFGVQRALLSEFVARFRGAWPSYWYLSDGGHFENMGAYELIRRRVPLIILVDAEADPDYEFQGLANLVRKARTDFGAEITFIGEDQLATRDLAGRFGTLEQMRRANVPQASAATRWSFGTKEPAGARPSRTHAALARVHYYDDEGNGSKAGSLLVYIKPTIKGDEPLDLIEYQLKHRTFPQQTTADQFFDEAQWESYRKLGEHIAAELFTSDGQDMFDRLLALKNDWNQPTSN